MIFKPGQESIIEMGVYHLKHSSNQVFEYDGEAGTGKSVVLKEMIRRAGIKEDEILPMAYTGSAAIVMRTKGFRNATTVHSGIYHIEKDVAKNDDNVLMNTQFNAPMVEEHFVVDDHLNPKIKVLAIDEGGMIPEQMKPHIEKFGLPVIVTGDKGQLPPINAKPAYLYRDDIPHLSELMRQSEYDGIVYIARRARRGLPIHAGRYGNALVIEEDEFNQNMIACSNIILCGTNRRREKLNEYIRYRLLNIHSTLPVYGDRMICRKNNWNVEVDGIALANGLVGTVVSYPDVSSFTGRDYNINFLPDLVQTPFDNVICDYKYLTGTVEERRHIKNSPFPTAELFEYAYALTTHLAQGSEYNGGVYIEESLGGNIQNNLNYTGVTRFKKWMIYIKRKRKFYNVPY